MPTYPTAHTLERATEHARHWPNLGHGTNIHVLSHRHRINITAYGRRRRIPITAQDPMVPFPARRMSQQHPQRADQSMRVALGNELPGFQKTLPIGPPASQFVTGRAQNIYRSLVGSHLSEITQIANYIIKTRRETQSTPLKAMPWPEAESRPEGTLQPQSHLHLASEFELYIHQAQGETFADGMSSTFTDRVLESIKKHGPAAVRAWEQIVIKTGNTHETGEELLRQLGILMDHPSHEARLQTLANFLEHPDPRMRDAAGLGLSFLDDPKALPLVGKALSQEQELWLKGNLALVIKQLEHAQWPSS